MIAASRLLRHVQRSVEEKTTTNAAQETFVVGLRNAQARDTAQSVVANLTAMMHALADDENPKNMFANSAFENFEIAAYNSLLALCGPAGADRAKPLLEMLLEEEQLAEWIDANVKTR